MSKFRVILLFEGRRVVCKRNGIIFIILVVLTLFLLQDGISTNQSILQRREPILFNPPPMSICFSHPGMFDQLVLPGDFMNFGGILFLFGSLFGLLYGYDALRSREYIRYIVNFTNEKSVFCWVIVSRVILLNLFFLLLTAAGLLFALVNGIQLFNLLSLYFYLVLALVITFFTICGAAAGMSKTKTAGVFAMIVVFFVFSFLIPWMVNKFARMNTGTITGNYEVELMKLKEFYTFSSLFPTTFYFSTCDELGGKGYISFIDFYNYSRDSKKDKNIFEAKSRIPGKPGLGIVMSLVYIAGVFILGYFRFRRYLYPLPERPDEGCCEGIDIELKKGRTITLNIFEPDFTNQFINAFCGQSRVLAGKVAINGNRFIPGEKRDFVYLPGFDTLPGEIIVGTFISFVCGLLKLSEERTGELKAKLTGKGIQERCRLAELEGLKRAILLLALAEAKNSNVYIFNDFITRLPGLRGEIKEKMEGLQTGRTLLVDIIFAESVNLSSDYKSMIVYDGNKSRYVELNVIGY
ncbi:MAG: hypothetical protein GTO45_08485 [Candidatus Aminicenantes bacterium]|nr:hypothetical protein [Candidatus Aminicenantes bacterium]NIM78868.1 hypothetical protein [Candidatus Aminicenantes bacterium]NIN18124.1 hypothetical protein [Candidatus Aminicenantes bacterium]NIN42023.1 hypothetical protein [Candidatus Aminicenantes bacterium]NIN84779.1 hypothetical protein [Candidatus Aminicenantes bacterium]